MRANGLLGYASANFAVLPGLAKSGVDYSYQSPAPLYPIDWEYAEAGTIRRARTATALFGANGLMQDSYGEILETRPERSGVGQCHHL